MVIDDISYVIEVVDTAGGDEYTVLRDQWIVDEEGFAIFYSVYDGPVFYRVSRFHQQIMNVNGIANPRIPVMLVGHDCNEDENGKSQRQDREVSLQEGPELGRELGYDFVEASAKSFFNVEKPIYDVVRALRKQRQLVIPVNSQ